MSRRVALERTDYPEESITYITKVTRIGELGKAFVVALMMEAILSSEISAFPRATRHRIPKDDILHSDRRENLISYIELTDWAL
jgi:hypothetical protein